MRGLTEPLIIAIDNLPAVVDDVNAIVLLVPVSQPVCGAKNDPQPQLTGQFNYVLGAPQKTLPIEFPERPEINTDVAGKTRLRKMHDVSTLPLRSTHLAQYVSRVRLNFCGDRQVAGGDNDLHVLARFRQPDGKVSDHRLERKPERETPHPNCL